MCSRSGEEPPNIWNYSFTRVSLHPNTRMESREHSQMIVRRRFFSYFLQNLFPKAQRRSRTYFGRIEKQIFSFIKKCERRQYLSRYSLDNSEQQPAKADNPAVAAMPLETKINLLLRLRHQLVLPNLLPLRRSYQQKNNCGNALII